MFGCITFCLICFILSVYIVDFSDNYHLIDVSELREVGMFFCEFEDVKGNNFISYDKNYNDRKEIPFTIESNFASHGFACRLHLDKEFV